jgi:aryl-alcohol dehydrogenase-like predicted oxidoreductase
MQQIALGRTELTVSRIVFGSMNLGSRARDPERRIAVMRAAVEAGIDTIDTAPIYDIGQTEEQLGRAIAGMRDRVKLLTKVGFRWDDPHGREQFRFVDEHGQPQVMRLNSRPESVRLEVERSLRRLGVDVLDLVQVHRPDPDTPIADTMGALLDCKRAGKLRAIGVSNFSAAQMRDAQAGLGDEPLASNQVHYSLLERWPEAELLPAAVADRISVLAYSPLEEGLLSDSFRLSALAEHDGRRRSARFHPTNLARIAEAVAHGLAPVAHAHGASVPQVALAFLLAQPAMAAVIVGASSVQQVKSNAGAGDLVLAADELAAIRSAFTRVRFDASAGQGLVGRVRHNARRVARGLKRRLQARLG